MESLKNFTDNDTYFIEVVSDKIVINDNYDGVLILDSELDVIKRIKLIDGLMIYTSFIKDKEIILYCYENQCLIHIDIDSYDYNIILLNEDLEDKIFLSLYEWVDNDLVLLADNGMTFVHANLLDNIAQIVQKDVIDRLQFSIHNNWNKLSKFIIHKVYPSENNAIVESNNVLMLMNYKNGTESILEIEPIKYHDIEVTASCVVQIGEKKISILIGSKNVILHPSNQQYSFLRGKFITIDKKVYLILLSGSNSDLTETKIEKHLIGTDI